MLKATFLILASKYHLPAEPLWESVATHYAGKGRHYHSLLHLENMLAELRAVQTLLEEEAALLFALYYHDIIYDPLRKDNEERSAALAVKDLHTLPQPLLERCVRHIHATKQHLQSTDADTNYFTDADLSILGQEWSIYETYAANVRKEYAMYPDLLYKPGRKKVLQHFLEMERIYKTPYFFAQYEATAKANLLRELENY